VLLQKLRHVFAGGEPERYLLPDTALPAFMEHCHKRIGEAYFRTPRNTITAFINLLAVLEQNPGVDCGSCSARSPWSRTPVRPETAMPMNSPASGSDPASGSFGLLEERIRRWVYDSGWTELRDAQERAIPPILKGEQDIIIAASTASGKTEAAFLPILTRMLANPGSLVIAVFPLVALINDQWGRLEQLCERLEVPVTPWHGDISSGPKKRFLKSPEGCLLITPESLEALLMGRGHALAGIFSKLLCVVVDELHSFIGAERGRQLQSLLHRIERALGRRVQRIGLSATLGDMALAERYLRSDAAFRCRPS